MKQEHKDNLIKGANWLKENITQNQFNMGCFRSYCDTIGCALGWMPRAFPDPIEPDYCPDHEYYRRVSLRLFGLSSLCDGWEWCFSGDWSSTDNTVRGAVSRMKWLAEKGLPDNWGEQMGGHEPLCYMEEE